MKKTIFNVFLFATGAAVGSLVTWRILKTKYDRLIQEEIDSVKETFARMAREESTDEEEICEDDEEDDRGRSDDDAEWDPAVLTEYETLAGRYGRSSDVVDDNDKEGGGDDGASFDTPEVITPEECGDGTFDHSIHCLTYYSDGVLADDWFGTYNIEDTIGEDALNHFGEYVDDVVYVRNYELKADYEVTRDDRKFSEMVEMHPLAKVYAD